MDPSAFAPSVVSNNPGFGRGSVPNDYTPSGDDGVGKAMATGKILSAGLNASSVDMPFPLHPVH
jgi:hypothetical protein